MKRGVAGWPSVVHVMEYFGIMEKEIATEATELRKGIAVFSDMDEPPKGLDLTLEVEWAAKQKLDKAFFKGAREAMSALSAQQRQERKEMIVGISDSGSGAKTASIGAPGHRKECVAAI